jgi:hypothetical protein
MQLYSDGWMKDHGFIDETTIKEEETKKLRWGGATIKVCQPMAHMSLL